MSDPLDPEERAQVERTKLICVRIAQALDGVPPSDSRLALAITLAQLCLLSENPDRVFLESLDGALGVFRDVTNTKYRNEDKAVS